MVLPGFCQKDCINGLTKEEAQSVKDIPTIEDSIDGIETQIGNMTGDIEDLQLASINFADHFDTLDGKVRNLESGVSGLDDEITEIKTITIPNISTQVNTLQNSTIPGLDARIGTIENSEIPDINSDISDINDAIDTINNTTIPDLQTDLDDGIQVVTDAIGGLDDRVTALESGSGYELITGDKFSIDKDKILFVYIVNGVLKQFSVRQMFMPAGINPNLLINTTLLSFSYYTEDSGNQLLNSIHYNFNGMNYYSGNLIGIKLTQTEIHGGGSGSQQQTYTLINNPPSQLSNGFCCIYQKI